MNSYLFRFIYGILLVGYLAFVVIINGYYKFENYFVFIPTFLGFWLILYIYLHFKERQNFQEVLFRQQIRSIT